ncbi:centrosomal protein of 83 kDa isoform X1 [Kryptolebias marmoratus]|uniref:centrosomal protein of 83 kDa isoform X1 n=1 Tax=Kryptolebias marmoratus TaxID=37003 RepID=UPI0007F8DF93|nr:centrosomal protein of 83 kDa isoform X1 [Kryptolebias marmoratus]XP_024857846.1 centrosomal protein of 83 kDa isoform X1 [Kryptolebias marmoratus]
MTSSALGQPAPLASGLEPRMGKSAAVLALSAGLRGAEMELQKMLIDERIKSEKHRTNYQTLKAEHTSLQDEFTRAQGELKRLLGERQSQQEKLQLLLAELRGELLDKTRELEELRLQVMTPQRLELLRAQVQQEMEAPVRERFNKLEEETEKYRSEYNKIRYEFTFLKSQCEHQREEHARALEERRILYEAEIARLEKDREELAAQRRGPDPLSDGKRVEALLREKAQLHLRLKGLEAEAAELRAQKENSGQQAESVQRIQIRQLSESQAAVKSLEAERQSLRQQLERLESELRLGHEQNAQLTGRLHKAEREVAALASQMASLKHAHKLEVAGVKLECSRSKGEAERERDSLLGQVDGLQADVEVLKAAVERHREVLAEKEREAVRKVQSAREEEFRKTAALHEEKLELENRLAALEQQRALQDASDQALKEEWEERLRGAQQGEESARRELQNLRSKLQQQSSQLEEAGRQTAEISDLQQHNQELSVQLAALSHSESDLTETNQRLRETLDRVRDELRTARTQAERSQHEAERCRQTRSWANPVCPRLNRLLLPVPQAGGVPSGGVAGGETPAAAARGRAAAETLRGQREAAESGGGSEEGRTRLETTPSAGGFQLLFVSFREKPRRKAERGGCRRRSSCWRRKLRSWSWKLLQLRSARCSQRSKLSSAGGSRSCSDGTTSSDACCSEVRGRSGRPRPPTSSSTGPRGRCPPTRRGTSRFSVGGWRTWKVFSSSSWRN